MIKDEDVHGEGEERSQQHEREQEGTPLKYQDEEAEEHVEEQLMQEDLPAGFGPEKLEAVDDPPKDPDDELDEHEDFKEDFPVYEPSDYEVGIRNLFSLWG